jgi:glycosyltransferase involved in cell wall biosynthesis
MRRAQVSTRTLPPLRRDASVAAVVPVLDEAAAIVGVLAELRDVGVERIVVVDGGSRDGTAELAQDAGAVVIRELRRGYGRACLTGAEAAGSDIVVFLDGDGSDDPAFIPQLLACIREGGAALALGARSRREPGAMLAHQMIGNRLVSALVSHVHGVRVDDVPPMRAIRSDVLTGLRLREMSYGWPTEMIVRTARAGLPIAQVHVHTRRRRGGESKIAGRLWPSLMAGAGMVRVVLRSR